MTAVSSFSTKIAGSVSRLYSWKDYMQDEYNVPEGEGGKIRDTMP